MVFDSSAKFNNVSLNDVQLNGPDITNNLQGILLRFRREETAVIWDVEQMFHNCKVKIDHQDYLHIFASREQLRPALKGVQNDRSCFSKTVRPQLLLRTELFAHSDPDVIDFVSNNFYVDDGLLSCPSEEVAADLMKKTRQALKEGDD